MSPYGVGADMHVSGRSFCETFPTGSIDAGTWTVLKTGTNATDFTGSESGRGGVVGDTGTTDNGYVGIHGGPAFDARNGPVFVRTQMRIARNGATAGTSWCLNFGLTDEVADVPVELSGTTFTSNAATFVGFVLDHDAGNTDFHAFWVDDNNDAAPGIADLRFEGYGKPDEGVTFTLEIAAVSRGGKLYATFLINGKIVGRHQTNVDDNQLLRPIIIVEARAAHQYDVTIDVIEGNAGIYATPNA